LLLAETMIDMSLQASGEVRRMRAAVARELDALIAAMMFVRARLTP
jgi:hypothetical protein